MKVHPLKFAMCLSALLSVASLSTTPTAQAAFLTERDYVGGIPFTAAGSVSLADFTVDVQAGYDAGLGGVIRDNLAVDDPYWPNDTTRTNFSATYNGGLDVLTATRTNSGSFVRTNSATASPISGGYWLASTQPGNVAAFAFSTPLTHWGVTMLSRNAARTYSILITHDDLSTETFGGISVPAATDGANNTFFGYESPLGRTITAVQVSTNTSNMALDDMAFVAVPEPASMALAVLGIAAATMGRFWRRSKAS